jgi:hypothetical protein
MTTALEATDKDFEQMTQMLTGFFVTQIAGAVATYSIADQLAKGPATAAESDARLYVRHSPRSRPSGRYINGKTRCRHWRRERNTGSQA